MPLCQRCRSLYLRLQYTLNVDASETLPHFSEGGATFGNIAFLSVDKFAQIIEPGLQLPFC